MSSLTVSQLNPLNSMATAPMPLPLAASALASVPALAVSAMAAAMPLASIVAPSSLPAGKKKVEVITFAHPDPQKANDYRYSIRKRVLESLVARARADGEPILLHAKNGNLFYAVEQRINGVWQNVMFGKFAIARFFARSIAAFPDGICYVLFNRHSLGDDFVKGSLKIMSFVKMIKLSKKAVQVENRASASMVAKLSCGSVDRRVSSESVRNEIEGLTMYPDVPHLLQADHVLHEYEKEKIEEGTGKTIRQIKSRVFFPFCPLTLFDTVMEKPRLNQEKKINIALQLLDGIAALHKKGIIHRDLKLENIFHSPDGDIGKILIADMDLHCHQGDLKQRAKAKGTPQMIAPESLEANVESILIENEWLAINREIEKLSAEKRKGLLEKECNIYAFQALDRKIQLKKEELKELESALIEAEQKRINSVTFAGDLWATGNILYDLFGSDCLATSIKKPWGTPLLKECKNLTPQQKFDVKMEAYDGVYKDYFSLARDKRISPEDCMADYLRHCSENYKYTDGILKAVQKLIATLLHEDPTKRSTAADVAACFRQDFGMRPDQKFWIAPSSSLHAVKGAFFKRMNEKTLSKKEALDENHCINSF